MVDEEIAASDVQGHRKRLRERLLLDPDGLHDYELIEYLLGLTLRRVDTKPIAKDLLRRFGSLNALMDADAMALTRVEGLGEVSVAALRIARATAIRLLRERATAAPILSNWQALADYLHADMAHDTIERFRVLHLNTRNMIMRDEVMAQGTIDQAAVHVREVIKRALDTGAAALILVHNHPSGDPSPSRADIDITRAIVAAARPLGILVHDHVIVAGSGQLSLRAKGLI
ncbi:DNA repair protein RadC [Sphingomonas sp. RRHST34]|jgi:DNA repair protein RadC|uniref:DNA repair protein RadC n=1 Tax=Sphingomonas citri TaxID=2862499 RepID=A0ABS7BJU1_9SPHN|nr:DNA repair protein RadC [Sphingomonas citri]MBW6529778.1 DNA repair protein RadC [Sphingomonas citri]